MNAEDGPPAKRFMLHRSLSQFDLFTSAVDLTPRDLDELASSQCIPSCFDVSLYLY